MHAYLNAKAFIARLSGCGFPVSAATFSKLKKQGRLPPPDARIGTICGWRNDTVNRYIRRLSDVQKKIGNNPLEAKNLGYWLKIYSRHSS